MKCHICHAKNVTAGHILGHGGVGIPKTLTKAERHRKADRLELVRYRGGRKPGATNLATRAAEAKP